MRFKIPQNVQVEDKILGPLSMRDLAVAGFGGGIAYVAYLKLDDQTWPFVSVPIVLLTLAIIFAKINDMRFPLWSYNLFLFLIIPQKRVWQNMSNSDYVLDEILNPSKKEEKKEDSSAKLMQEKAKKVESLEKLSLILDHGEVEKTLDVDKHIDEAEDHELVLKSFHNATPREPITTQTP